MAFKQFGWVPDGTYDSQNYQVRYRIADGNPTRVITRSWLEDGGPNDVADDMKLPWGTYPNIPEKK